MKKEKLYTHTNYGTIHKGGVFISMTEKSFYSALYEARTEGIGIAVFEKDIYTDKSFGNETKKYFLFHVTKVVTKAEAISLNETENMGYENLETIDINEWFYIESQKVLMPKDKGTFALPNNF